MMLLKIKNNITHQTTKSYTTLNENKIMTITGDMFSHYTCHMVYYSSYCGMERQLSVLHLNDLGRCI